MAQSTRDIKRRMQSIDNTRQITKAMEMIAAAKLRKAQERVERGRPYVGQIADTLRRVVHAAHKFGDELPAIAQRHEGAERCLIAITADRGLAGGYNANVLRRADQYLQENPGTQLILVGRRGRDYYRHRGQQFLAEYVNLGDEIGFRQAQEIGHVVEEFYTSGLFQRLDIVYNYFVNPVTQRIDLLPILPLTEPDSVEDDAGRGSYIFEPSLGVLLQTLVPQYVNTVIFQALVEAFASEQGARMNAMHSATDNATELIKQLNLSFNRARQAAITTEISEIVGGAEALQS